MGARITLKRRLEWADTDAAVRWHHSTTWRLIEWAEAEMHRRLGIIDTTFGFTPRRRVEAEFHRAVYFDQEMTVDLAVVDVGRTSATYEMTISVEDADAGGGDGDGLAVAATARMVAVLIDGDGRSTPWPAHVRDALLDGTAHGQGGVAEQAAR